MTSPLIERVARALWKSDPLARGYRGDWQAYVPIARAAIEAMGLSEVIPVEHTDFLELTPFVKGRPALWSPVHAESVFWPALDGRYRVFVMIDAALEGEG